MSYNNLTYEIENRINIISINRPEKLNALNIETFSEIDHAIKSSTANDAAHGADAPCGARRGEIIINGSIN